MNTHESPLQLLKAVPCFSDLAPSVRAAIAARCQPLSLRRDQLVFMVGERCRGLYMLESGRVRCYQASADGREQTMRIHDRPGDVFCIPSVFGTGRHIVSASAMIDSRLYLLDRNVVIRIASEHPSVAMSVIATAGEHMTSLVALTENLSLKTATARLAKLIYDLATHEAVQSGKKVRLSRARLREEEIGSIIGTVRVNVSRSLRNLAGAGAICLNRRFIEICDLSVLERLSEGTTLSGWSGKPGPKHPRGDSRPGSL